MKQEPNNADQQIDLAEVSRKVKQKISGLQKLLVRSIFFIKSNIIPLTILVIGGGVIGFYLDRNVKVYDHKLVVMPNFGSVDYVYSKVELLDSKVKEKDTAFLANLGIIYPSKLREIKIKPINTVYDFVHQRPTNFELLRLMSENGNIEKVVESDITSKNYSSHLLTFSTQDKTDRNYSIEPLLKYLNSSTYYDLVKQQNIKNVKEKMKANDSIITQIDKILNKFSSEGGTKSGSLIYNENTEISEIIKRKDELITEQGFYRISLLNYTNVVKEISSTLNIRNKEGLSGKLKFVFPLLLVLMYLIVVTVLRIIKSANNTDVTN